MMILFNKGKKLCKPTWPSVEKVNHFINRSCLTKCRRLNDLKKQHIMRRFKRILTTDEKKQVIDSCQSGKWKRQDSGVIIHREGAVRSEVTACLSLPMSQFPFIGGKIELGPKVLFTRWKTFSVYGSCNTHIDSLHTKNSTVHGAKENQ